MKYAVIGSRTFNNYELLKSTLDEYDDIDCIISGGASGADKLSEQYAKENNIPTIIYKANWKDMNKPCVVGYNQYGVYNKLSGMKRNTLIIQDCDVVIVFWDMKSKGTKDSINKSKKQNKIVNIIDISKGMIRC